MMDLPCVQWQDHVAQKWIRLDPELKEHFTSLLEVDDVFKCALTLTTQDDLDMVQSISAGYCAEKDTEKAAKCRESGNSSFKVRDYTAAALHYSQGVCVAPRCSEQLSLCYANRSAALYHLQHYQESLDDMDEALKNGYPSHLSHKLEDRRTQCLERLSLSEKAKEDKCKPASKNHGGSDGLKTASVGLLPFGIGPQIVVGFNPEKGRHLMAAERIEAGEVILTDRPYGCVLIPGMEEEVRGSGGKRHKERSMLFGVEHRRCHRCLSETLCPVPCGRCTYSRYCSTSCQRDAWEEHHRWECSLRPVLMAFGVLSELAWRIAFKAKVERIALAVVSKPISLKGESSVSDPCHTSHCGDSYLSVFHLLHHLDRHSPALRFLCAVTVATLYLNLSKAGPPPAARDLRPASGANSQPSDEEGGHADWSSEQWLLGSAVLRHFLQLRCNAQAILMLQDTGAENSPVQSSREIRIATAIFPTISLLNHSCCPNTSLVFSTGTSTSDLSADLSESVDENGRTAREVTATVRAAKVIDAGQEILHCYGPQSSRMATQERQRLLQEQYYFLCQCEACTQQQEGEGTQHSKQWMDVTLDGQESGLLCGKCKGSLKKSIQDGATGFICSQSSCGQHMSSSEVSHRLQEIRVHLKKAVDIMEGERPDEALTLLRRTQCQTGLILAETHPLQGELADAMARVCATMGDWNKAASHLERSAVAVGHQYGKDSIELGRQLFKLAQLHFNGGCRDQTLSIIPKARRLLCLHCGPDCHELQELQAMDDCLRG